MIMSDASPNAVPELDRPGSRPERDHRTRHGQQADHPLDVEAPREPALAGPTAALVKARALHRLAT